MSEEKLHQKKMNRRFQLQVPLRQGLDLQEYGTMCTGSRLGDEDTKLRLLKWTGQDHVENSEPDLPWMRTFRIPWYQRSKQVYGISYTKGRISGTVSTTISD